MAGLLSYAAHVTNLPVLLPRRGCKDAGVVQLLSWKAYSAAKRAGTLHPLVESMRPAEVANQAGSLKRKRPEPGDADAAPVTQEAAADGGRMKKLKTTLDNCRMM